MHSATNQPSVLQLPQARAGAAAADEITFIGTATTLIRIAGFTILTDPNFLHRGDRAYVGWAAATATGSTWARKHLKEA